jgi:superfamily II DNA or RNA helicase
MKKEIEERNYLKEHEDENRILYPTLNDPLFNVKIAEKKEFNDTQYDGTIYDVKAQADILAKADFELQPHQMFVRNFMSFNTPYNSLLLYHGLGSGKTCSAIGVCEEMRDYLKQTGSDKKIIIVASPNVQDNFRLQLFDERKLKTLGEDIWSLGGCNGNKLLNEIQPIGTKGLTREKIISQIKVLINTYYDFIGYTEFSNYLERKHKVLRSEFSNRLIVIDEVHNIIDESQKINGLTDKSSIKKIAGQMMKLVKTSENVRLLLLSATPMYNSYKEIIWLMNLMNLNDKRASVEISDIFDKEGNFRNKDLFMQKITGYVSYVRGENPYTFPYKVFPFRFSPLNTFPAITLPTIQMNMKKIDEEESLKVTSLFMLNIGEYQKKGYNYIIDNYKTKEFHIETKNGDTKTMATFENMKSFGYTLLRIPLEALNIVYPIDVLDNGEKYVGGGSGSISEDRGEPSIEGEGGGEEGEGEGEGEEEDQSNIRLSDITGINGLSRIMNFTNSKSQGVKGGFAYKQDTLEKYGRIFSYEKIGNYSCKIKNICDNIINKAEGIIMIYSEYLDSGLIPAVLAIEELGLTRFGGKSLFKEEKERKLLIKGQYAFITGDKRLSPDNNKEIKSLTNDNNKNGEKIKVVFISRAGAEGLDLKFIRQVHIMEPWYNMNRIEQIIGRAVRNFSHKELPFEQRNVQIFLYGTILENPQEEAADVYVYRFAENKAIKIGKITRLMKETAVDCILNHSQTNFTIENMKQNVKQILSNKMVINDFKIGDESYSSACDYMEQCEYKCSPNAPKSMKILEENYNEKFIDINTDRIIQKIKILFFDKVFYRKSTLMKMINTPKPYPISQIYFALTKMIEGKDIIVDKYGRQGYLINNADYYLFQPSELHNENISLFDRERPLEYKFSKIKIPEQEILNNSISEDTLISEENHQTIFVSHKQDAAREKYNTTMEIYSSIKEDPDFKIGRGDEDWYKHCGITIYKMEKEGYDADELFLLLIDHIMDTMKYADKLSLLKQVFMNTEDTFMREIKEYFENKMKTIKTLTYITLYNKDEPVFLKLENKKWLPVTELENLEIMQNEESIDIEDQMNNIIGFISYNKVTDTYIFKLKNNDMVKNLGASCEQMNKIKKINILNLIVNSKKYTSENTRGMVQSELCSFIELILRFNTKQKRNGKTWFYDNEIKLKKN